MFTRDGSNAYKPGLQTIIKLCEKLGNPHEKFKSIHIGGTNGKGSTSHMIAAILQTSGYKTGLYTSPHLKRFTERIKINGEEINETTIVNFVQNNIALIEEIKPSFFEITTALAFEYFALQKVDIAVIEVGLGGRLDATNIITPIVSIITNIGWDHTDILGDTLEKIAYEKAGIIKPGIPVIISEYQPEIAFIFTNKAKETGTNLYFTTDIDITEDHENENNLQVKVNNEAKYPNFKCGLKGKYQKQNLKAVFKLIEISDLLGIKVNIKLAIKALLEVTSLTGFKGRWQILGRDPLVVCDTGHNEPGIRLVVDQLAEYSYKRLFMVIGFVKDKDIDKILRLLPTNAYYLFTQPSIPRGLDADVLQDKALKFDLNGEVMKDINKAISKARSLAAKEDLIFIGGSTFVVAEIEEI